MRRLGCGVWVAVFGLPCLGCGVWVAVFGLRCLGCGVWVAAFGLRGVWVAVFGLRGVWGTRCLASPNWNLAEAGVSAKFWT